MRKELKYGNRLVFVSTEDRHSRKVFDIFYDLIKKAEEELTGIMDRYEIPSQIVLNFRKGKGDLDGTYFEQNKEVSDEMIIIDMYTGHLRVFSFGNKRADLKLELMDTFIHELVHNKYKSEERTYATAGKLAKEVMCCLQKHFC